MGLNGGSTLAGGMNVGWRQNRPPRDPDALGPHNQPNGPAVGSVTPPYDVGAVGVITAQNNAQNAYLNQQIGWQNQGYGLGQQGLNQQYGFDLASLGLDREALGIDRGAVGRQMGYYDSLFGLDGDRYRQGLAYQNALKGYRGRDLASQLHQLWAQGSQIRDKAMRDERDMGRAQTASGSFTSQGAKDGARDVKATKDYGLTNVDIAKAQANTSYERDMSGYDNTIANLTTDFKEAGLTHGEQQARLRDRMSTLDIESRRLGLSSDQLSSKLQLGLEKLKLDHTVSVGALLDAINQGNIGALGSIYQIINQGLGLYGTGD